MRPYRSDPIIIETSLSDELAGLFDWLGTFDASNHADLDLKAARARDTYLLRKDMEKAWGHVSKELTRRD